MGSCNDGPHAQEMRTLRADTLSRVPLGPAASQRRWVSSLCSKPEYRLWVQIYGVPKKERGKESLNIQTPVVAVFVTTSTIADAVSTGMSHPFDDSLDLTSERF